MTRGAQQKGVLWINELISNSGFIYRESGGYGNLLIQIIDYDPYVYDKVYMKSMNVMLIWYDLYDDDYEHDKVYVISNYMLMLMWWPLKPIVH